MTISENAKLQSNVPALKVQGISYQYSTKPALDNVSFEVLPGRFTALLGPNGAGKTTLFSLITRLFDSREGTIEISGLSVKEHGSQALGPLGVVFQQPTLDLDLSVRQNLHYFASLRGLSRKDAQNRMMESLHALNMAERVDEKVRLLNGGHRRRVEIARAILHDPELLLLDEPTIGLDVPTRSAIVEHIHNLARDKNIAVLWATHLFDEINADDDLILLHQGKVIKTGTARTIAEHNGGSLDKAFAKLTGSQYLEGAL